MPIKDREKRTFLQKRKSSLGFISNFVLTG